MREAIEKEQRKCEAEKVEAVQVHCEILEEQFRKRLANLKSEIQRERGVALALQQEVVELKTVRPLTYDITGGSRAVNYG